MTQVAQEIAAARERLAAEIEAGSGGTAPTHRFTDAVTQTVARVAAPVVGEGAAVVAVGALGRGELGPHSDLDLVFLLPSLDGSSHEDLEPRMQALVHPLWDAGLQVQASVQDPDGWLAAAAEELTVCTSLLDARAVAGDEELVARLRVRATERFFGVRRAPFLHRLVEEVAQRHLRYGGTVYKVEPDLKYGPGGLRDLAVVHWCVMAAYGTADLGALAGQGDLSRRLATLLADARDVLLRIRVALHMAVGRASDRLAFQNQERMLPYLGGRGGSPKADDEEVVAAIEGFMRAYYGAASTVLRFGRRVCEGCVPPRARPSTSRRVDERFRVVDGQLHADGDRIFGGAPVLALDALALARDEGVRLHGDTFDEVAEVAAEPVSEGLAREPAAHLRFMELLMHPGDVGTPSAMELCNELGLLERIIPEMGPCRARMQHEGLHVYTVDQHSLRAVAFLKSVVRGDHRKDFPLATAMHLDMDDVGALYLATLLHDVGKALGGDQCETGARVVADVAGRLGFGPDGVDRCAWLVRNHMEMPRLSQKRDLTDPILLGDFVGTLPDRQALRELYLLSLADMTQVRPGYLTSWKLALLDELYLRAAATLRGKAVRSRRGSEEGLPDRYYALYDAELRERHRTLVDRVASGRQALALELTEASGGLRLTLVASDEPGLLARVAVVMDNYGLEVLAADIFSVAHETTVALDVFRVRSRPGFDPPDGERIVAMERALPAARPDPATKPLPRPSGRARRILTDVALEADTSGRQTIVEVQTGDQSGALRRITAAFAACEVDILLARCLSEAGRVTDVFYVPRLTEAMGQRLTERLHEYLRRA